MVPCLPPPDDTLLSLLCVCVLPRFNPTWQEYRECIEQLAGASQHSIRTVAASALVAFVWKG